MDSSYTTGYETLAKIWICSKMTLSLKDILHQQTFQDLSLNFLVSWTHHIDNV